RSPQIVRSARVEDDSTAFGMKNARDCTANAARRARDQRSLALEIKAHEDPPVSSGSRPSDGHVAISGEGACVVAVGCARRLENEVSSVPSLSKCGERCAKIRR